MASTACFMIVSRNDIPIYEAEVGTAPKVIDLCSTFFFIKCLSGGCMETASLPPEVGVPLRTITLGMLLLPQFKG